MSTRWSGRRTAAAIGIAVVIAAGGGAVIGAANANDSGTATGTTQRPGGGRFFGMGALDAALHGEFVVAGGTTELLQTGKVTEISATSISLTSTDGYAKSYTIDASTLIIDNGIKAGDEVTVIAKKSDNVAISVIDRTKPGGRRGLPLQPPQPRP